MNKRQRFKQFAVAERQHKKRHRKYKQQERYKHTQNGWRYDIPKRFAEDIISVQPITIPANLVFFIEKFYHSKPNKRYRGPKRK